MKALIIFSLLSFAAVANANQTLVCNSSDFNAEKYDGQSLKITLDNNNRLLAVEKMEGSWFCDSGKVESPNVLAIHSTSVVYESNFGCDELYGRVIIPTSGKVSSINYEFGYPDDEANRKYSDKLNCK
jgi:hypothetical protein